jgi:hypothetical protein
VSDPTWSQERLERSDALTDELASGEGFADVEGDSFMFDDPASK